MDHQWCTMTRGKSNLGFCGGDLKDNGDELGFDTIKDKVWASHSGEPHIHLNKSHVKNFQSTWHAYGCNIINFHN